MLHTDGLEELLPPPIELNRMQMKKQLIMQEQEGRE
jgi:hypothetical protein